MKKIRIAIVGLGKIARDQHLPSLEANPAFELVAVASPRSTLDGIPCYDNLQALLSAVVDVDAVSLCTTPQVRYDIARIALEHGVHVMLEKPPGATLSEVASLVELAERRRLALFATWHSREAPAVEPARQWLAQRKLRGVTIHWQEDVRVWHPGQTWIWQAGGLGVFDPGINALSIATRILPGPLVLRDAELSMPTNCATPIAARLQLDMEGVEVTVALDFLHTGTPRWDIEVDTDGGRLLLAKGGSTMYVDGEMVLAEENREYPRLYARFETLVRKRELDVDMSALRLVADAFLCGRHVRAEPFVE